MESIPGPVFFSQLTWHFDIIHLHGPPQFHPTNTQPTFPKKDNTPHQPVWSNYNDLTRPHPKWWFSKGIPLISGKSRLVKYYNLARTCANLSALLEALSLLHSHAFLRLGPGQGELDEDLWQSLEERVRPLGCFCGWRVVGGETKLGIASHRIHGKDILTCIYIIYIHLLKKKIIQNIFTSTYKNQPNVGWNTILDLMGITNNQRGFRVSSVVLLL